MDDRATPIRVLYVGGAGRSGSTLLERILGNVEGLFSVGEVRFLWQYAVRGGTRCGCGAALAACPFWSQVLADLERDGLRLSRVATLAERVDRTRHTLWGAALFGRELAELRAATGRLYAAIARHAGDRTIVDTSKTPAHLGLLLGVPAIEPRVLHLVRDARAVAYAWNRRVKADPGSREGRMPARSTLRAAAVWTAENLLTTRLARRCPYHAALRYESFVRRPAEELGGALHRLGIDYRPEELPHAGVFHAAETHSVGGNPVRFDRGPIQIREDREWRRAMPAGQRLAVSLIALPMLWRQGYPLRLRPEDDEPAGEPG